LLQHHFIIAPIATATIAPSSQALHFAPIVNVRRVPGMYRIPKRDSEDDWPPALGKQGSIVISPVKRVKADSVNTTIKKLVNEAAVSAAKASSSVPPSIGRFCLISLGHSPEDCLETCHIVPRALVEDEVLSFRH